MCSGATDERRLVLWRILLRIRAGKREHADAIVALRLDQKTAMALIAAVNEQRWNDAGESMAKSLWANQVGPRAERLRIAMVTGMKT